MVISGQAEKKAMVALLLPARSQRLLNTSSSYPRTAFIHPSIHPALPPASPRPMMVERH